ncbi:ribulose-phosphate 3-epimerase, cytoplasmic isoform-like [Papaver somniferum]|uniref:ribulose-phosphate 3-epimerase, cytoplasmic isoform-like n=1 Tax=Papaver somniferum TaxID=3469 RepID=UPI000E6FB06E|nr:ribulose-phosphate 3-epimerase, cytoplasmic isoform-like [Papaver somniferum]
MKFIELKLIQAMECADLSNLGYEAERMIKAGFNSLHIDISDGHFVDNITVGPSVVESLWKRTKANLECHLMVTDPLRYVEPLAKAVASGFTFHIEASKGNWRELVRKIKAKGMRPAVALKAETPVEEVFPLVEDDEYPVDMVLIMTVEHGFGKGESFMPKMCRAFFATTASEGLSLMPRCSSVCPPGKALVLGKVFQVFFKRNIGE